MKKITVYCELDSTNKKLKDVSYELITKAYELSLKAEEMQNEKCIVEAVALCDEINEESAKLTFKAGASKLVLIQDKSLQAFCQTVYTQSFIEYYKDNESDIIIFPATMQGRIVAPRITTSLNTGLVADCTGLDLIIRENKIKFAPTRPTFGSELMATIISKNNPQCATIRPKTFEAKFDKNLDEQIVVFKPNSYEEPRIKLIKTLFEDLTKSADFSNAKIVFAAGYGLVDKKDRKYFTRLEKLAEMSGAKVASTRKLVDMGLMPTSSQIGQTGSNVCADLYIAFGVSGAIQHVMGMKNSKTIIAINTDKNAEIFKYADYKIVADAKEIIDNLLQKLS